MRLPCLPPHSESPGAMGGAIHASSATLIHSTFSRNAVTTGGFQGEDSLTGFTGGESLTGAYGGGGAVMADTLTAKGCTFEGNYAEGEPRLRMGLPWGALPKGG
jgi:hypothetical protein